MIINKPIPKYYQEDSSILQSMSSYVSLFLKTEITCIPSLLQRYLGDYYNNGLCNGATWVFALWCILHTLFDRFIDGLLKKIRYKEYVRERMKCSLWYMGFYSSALVYCGAALSQNDVELFNFKKMSVPASTLPTKVVLGYALIVTFYLHSAVWEGLAKAHFIRMFNYFFLFLFMVSSYLLKIVEISFTFTALMGMARVAVEFVRCFYMCSVQESFLSKWVMNVFYTVAFMIYLMLHVFVIPLTFTIPLGLKIMSDYPNILLVFLFFNLCGWMVTEVCQSIVFKCIDHWLYHKEAKKDLSDEQSGIVNVCEGTNTCATTLLECSLFPPRNDVYYKLGLVRREIKARKDKMLAMRKPKNMLFQTLKCMVAIKKKLHEKRQMDKSSDKSAEELVITDITDTDEGVQTESEDEAKSVTTDSPEEKVYNAEVAHVAENILNRLEADVENVMASKLTEKTDVLPTNNTESDEINDVVTDIDEDIKTESEAESTNVVATEPQEKIPFKEVESKVPITSDKEHNIDNVPGCTEDHMDPCNPVLT